MAHTRSEGGTDGTEIAHRRGNAGRRLGSTLAVCALAAGAIALTAHLAARSGGARSTVTTGGLPAGGITQGRYLLIRDATLDADYGRVGVVPAADPGGHRMMSGLRCDRIDYEGGRGLCLSRPTSAFGATTATIVDADLHPLRTVDLTGYPNRVRVSPDGRYAATTTFVSGDSYATMGQFSTRTDIIDLVSGRILFDLSSLRVTMDGRPFTDDDRNFWGVTFAPDGHSFYATLGTDGGTYLIRADLLSKDATVLRSGVECPSLSPDGTRIAFKSRNPGEVATWRLSVLDLSTLQSHPLAETRDVDDQPAWLGNGTVLYGLVRTPPGDPSGASAELSELTVGGSVGTDTWEVPADGSGRPRVLVADAWSTVVVDGATTGAG